MGNNFKKTFGEFERKHVEFINAIGRKTLERIMILMGTNSSDSELRKRLDNSIIDDLLDSALEDLEKIVQREKLKEEFLKELKEVIIRIGISVILGSI